MLLLNGQPTSFRYSYSKKRRRKEKRYYKYQRQFTAARHSTYCTNNTETIQEIENRISSGDKPTNLSGYIEWFSKRQERQQFVQPFYQLERWRRNRFYSYINTRRSEDRFINELGKRLMDYCNKNGIFISKPQDVIVAFGDACKSPTNPNASDCKYLQEAFKRGKYNVIMIDENNTSQTCSTCLTKSCHNFHKRNSYDLYKVWTLLGCSNCNKVFNRDRNAAINIGRILWWQSNGESLPNVFIRGTEEGKPITKPVGWQKPLSFKVEDRQISRFHKLCSESIPKIMSGTNRQGSLIAAQQDEIEGLLFKFDKPFM